MSELAPLNHPRSKTDLFVSFTLLALQGFGGVLAVVQREVVERKRWMTQAQFVEDWAVAQILPGPNVINFCLIIGGRYFGLRGALAALAGMGWGMLEIDITPYLGKTEKVNVTLPGYVIQRIDRYVREHKVKSRSSFLADAALEKWVRS